MTQPRSSERSLFKYSALTWVAVATAGQVLFASFIVVFYAWGGLDQGLARWNANPLLAVPPYSPESITNTFAFGLHAIGAAYIAMMGVLQLMRPVRSRYPRFHHWNGRVYLSTVVALTLSGYYLVWIRGPQPESFSELATSANGVLILLFAFFTIRAAIAKEFAVHRKWALRLYLVANAQWFLRIGGFGYFVLLNSLGIEVNFESAFFVLWTWGCFLVPLAICQLYLVGSASGGVFVQLVTTLTLVFAIVATAVGSLVFSMYTLQIVLGNQIA